jgi:hypothetical protein
VGRLYSSLFALLVVFSAGMSFVTLGVYASQWWWSVIGVAIVVVFVVLGGLLVPPARRGVATDDQATAAAAVQALGALCACEFFVMALVCWVVGNRSLFDNNAYQALGLVLFLGLIGVGIPGVLFTVARLVYVWNWAREKAVHHVAA